MSIPTIGFDATDLSTAASYWFPPGWEFLGDGMVYETWAKYSGLNVQTRLQNIASSSVFCRLTLLLSVGCANTTTTVYWEDHEASAFPTSTNYVNAFNSTMTLTPVAITYNPCTPYLSVPSRLLTLDPRWSTCVRYMAGLHDPPINLDPENGFYPCHNYFSRRCSKSNRHQRPCCTTSVPTILGKQNLISKRTIYFHIRK